MVSSGLATIDRWPTSRSSCRSRQRPRARQRGGDFEPVLALADLPVGSLRRVTRGDLDVLVANTSAGLLATDDRCPHMSAPLSQGRLEGCVVDCPLHSGRFDLVTGEVVQFPSTGGLDADGDYHPTWQSPGSPPKPEATDAKAMARRQHACDAYAITRCASATASSRSRCPDPDTAPEGSRTEPPAAVSCTGRPVRTVSCLVRCRPVRLTDASHGLRIRRYAPPLGGLGLCPDPGRDRGGPPVCTRRRLTRPPHARIGTARTRRHRRSASCGRMDQLRARSRSSRSAHMSRT